MTFEKFVLKPSLEKRKVGDEYFLLLKTYIIRMNTSETHSNRYAPAFKLKVCVDGDMSDNEGKKEFLYSNEAGIGKAILEISKV